MAQVQLLLTSLSQTQGLLFPLLLHGRGADPSIHAACCHKPVHWGTGQVELDLLQAGAAQLRL